MVDNGQLWSKAPYAWMWSTGTPCDIGVPDWHVNSEQTVNASSIECEAKKRFGSKLVLTNNWTDGLTI